MIRAVVIAAVVAIALGGCSGSRAPGAPGAPGTEGAEPAGSRVWERIGESRERRELQARTFGAGALRVYLVGGIHGSEAEGQQVVAELERRLAAPMRPAAAGEASGAGRVRILRDMNPDGTAIGRRGNAAGVDLNRNWPASNFRAAMRRGQSPLSEPEVAAAHTDMTAFGPDVILVLHSIGSGPFVNFDGPGAELAARFASAAAELDGRWRVVADMGYATPGSMGSYWGLDRGVPILTVEMARGEDSAAGVMAVVAGVEAVVASGFRPMAEVVECSSAPTSVRMPIAQKGDATVASGFRPLAEVVECSSAKTAVRTPIARKGDATVASGFRPMAEVTECSSARTSVRMPIARKGDATGGPP